MDIDVKTWLYDILNAINEIESYFIDIPKDFFVYASIEISNSRKIIDTRNRIIHGYDTVSDDIIWGIVIKHLPLLKSEVEKLLGE